MGMGGSSPTPPTLDTKQSADLLRQQLAIQREELPAMSVAAGNASRQESRRNIDFGLRLLGDQKLRSSYEAALPEEMRRRTELLGQLDAAQTTSPEFTRLQAQLQGAVGERAGMLSAQDARDATQQARAGMAARGMATGSAGLGAELLNRDRFVQQRRAQDLGILGQSAQLAEQERMRRMGLGQDAYNFSMGTNPAIMAMGMGSPYANLTQNSMAMVGGAQGLNPMYSGGQFSGGGFNMMGAGAGALGGALSGAAIGSVVPGIGTAAGAVAGGLAGGLGGGLSDKREKTDIKPLGKVTSLLDLPAYEYRYKGEKKKRKGVMAQDVQRVLPEAVTEVDYQGKRRLAIKPSVIGAALAEELTNQTKAVAA